MEQNIVMKYKGIILSENTFAGYLWGEGAYAVYVGDKKFPFKTIKEFKDAVNGVNPYKDICKMTVPYMENGKWGNGVEVEKFADFVKGLA